MKKRIFVILCIAVASVNIMYGQIDSENNKASIPETYEEVLAIQIKDIEKTYSVTSSDGSAVSLLSFGGTCDNDYFRGSVVPGGIDCQRTKGKKSSLSARYLLEGTDFAGDSCKIFIENNATANSNISQPQIITDSRALSFLNDLDLIGILDNNGPFTIRIYADQSGVDCDTSGVSHNGMIDTLRYDIAVNGKMIEKEALVYLPYCYDHSDNHTRYNVLYLAHGGGDNTGSFFSTERTPNPLNNIADELIQEGKMDPMMIVSVSYYPPEDICMSKGMDSTINYIRHFYRELRECIIPAVGKKYNTHLQSFDDASISATRQHRAYGGFSMGALSTWYQLAFDPQSFGQYVPMSGDLWIYDGKGEKESSDTAAKWLNDRIAASPYRDGDINIFAYSGTNDIAFGPESALIESLKKHCPLLEYSDNPESGNLHFLTEKDGVHNYEWISKYLNDVMPRLWKNTVKNSNDTD